jgi:two-component SAPR family response regulator
MGYLWTVVSFLGGLAVTAAGDMVSEEVRDRLDHLPQAILRLAARRLDLKQRVAVYEDEWLPELTYILKGDEARPVTRLYHGTRFALGILMSAHRTASYLRQADSLDEDIVTAKMLLAAQERRLLEVAAARGDARLLQRYRRDLADSQLVLEVLVERKRFVDRRLS